MWRVVRMENGVNRLNLQYRDEADKRSPEAFLLVAVVISAFVGSVRRFRDKHPSRMNQEITRGNQRWWWIIVRKLVAMSLLTLISLQSAKKCFALIWNPIVKTLRAVHTVKLKSLRIGAERISSFTQFNDSIAKCVLIFHFVKQTWHNVRLHNKITEIATRSDFVCFGKTLERGKNRSLLSDRWKWEHFEALIVLMLLIGRFCCASIFAHRFRLRFVRFVRQHVDFSRPDASTETSSFER